MKTKSRFEVEIMGANGVERRIETEADTALDATREAFPQMEDGDEYRVIQVKIDRKRMVAQTTYRSEDIIPAAPEQPPQSFGADPTGEAE